MKVDELVPGLLALYGKEPGQLMLFVSVVPDAVTAEQKSKVTVLWWNKGLCPRRISFTATSWNMAKFEVVSREIAPW